jgi:hypothetical protein
MPDKIYSSGFGAATTGLGMLSGVLSVSSVAQAVVLGFAGAIGGLLAQALWKYIRSKLKG